MYVATGLLIAGAVAGDTIGGGEGEGGAGCAGLLRHGAGAADSLCAVLRIHYTLRHTREIERNNLAVGIALGGNLIAIGW